MKYIKFSSVQDPAAWDTSDYGAIVFANHEEAKKAEALFQKMQDEITALRAARPEEGMVNIQGKIIYRLDEAVCEVLNFTDETTAGQKATALAELDAAVNDLHSQFMNSDDAGQQPQHDHEEQQMQAESEADWRSDAAKESEK